LKTHCTIRLYLETLQSRQLTTTNGTIFTGSCWKTPTACSNGRANPESGRNAPRELQKNWRRSILRHRGGNRGTHPCATTCRPKRCELSTSGKLLIRKPREIRTAASTWSKTPSNIPAKKRNRGRPADTNMDTVLLQCRSGSRNSVLRTERIFKRFYRVASSATAGSRHGLGLFIVRSIAAACGDAFAESEGTDKQHVYLAPSTVYHV